MAMCACVCVRIKGIKSEQKMYIFFIAKTKKKRRKRERLKNKIVVLFKQIVETSSFLPRNFMFNECKANKLKSSRKKT